MDLERFTMIFRHLSPWGFGEHAAEIAQRAFRVSLLSDAVAMMIQFMCISSLSPAGGCIWNWSDDVPEFLSVVWHHESLVSSAQTEVAVHPAPHRAHGCRS